MWCTVTAWDNYVTPNKKALNQERRFPKIEMFAKVQV